MLSEEKQATIASSYVHLLHKNLCSGDIAGEPDAKVSRLRDNGGMEGEVGCL